MRFSVIIPAYNEEKLLAKTLKSVATQDFDSFEIIVVSNGSTDKTGEVAKQYTHSVIELKEPHVSKARNAGAKKASGEILIFLDADTTMGEHALHAINAHYESTTAILVGKTLPFPKKLKYKLIPCAKNYLHKYHIFKGTLGCIAIQKDTYEKINGYNEDRKVLEHRDLIKKALVHGTYKQTDDVLLTTSMRRYEQVGVTNIWKFWIKAGVQSLSGKLKNTVYETLR